MKNSTADTLYYLIMKSATRERIQATIDRLQAAGNHVEVIDVRPCNDGEYFELRAWVNGTKRDFQFFEED